MTRLLLDVWRDLAGDTAYTAALASVACPGRHCADHSPTERKTAP